MPNNWKTYKLSDVAETNVSSISKNTSLKEILYLDTGSVTEGQFNLPEKLNISEAPSRAKRIVKHNDLIYSTVRPNQKHYALIKEPEDNLIVSTGFCVITPTKVDSDFLYYYLTTEEMTSYLHTVAEGSTTTYPSIKPSVLEELVLSLPPLKEQTQIANILSAIDDKIENNLATNKTLEDMAMALYKHWFVDFGPFQDGEFIDSDLGLIPKGWEVKSIGDIIDTLGGGTPKTSELSYWDNGDILWYSPTDLTRDNAMFSLDSSKKINELGLSKSSAKLFPPYSLLMSSRATIGALTINTKEASTNQGFITMIPNDKISIYQLYSWTKDNLDLIISKANGSTFKEISKTNFRNLDIAIGKDIDSFLRDSKDIFDKVENNIKENQSLINLRDTLLPKLISGEVRLKEFREQVENLV